MAVVGPAPAADPASEPKAGLIRRIGWGGRLEGAEAESFARMTAMLGRTVRASSAVEFMKGVLRMQLPQPKRMTQGMLDQKRL